jgi:hypothetical protein
MGSTSAMVNAPTFSLPVAASANYNFTTPERLFKVHIEDAGTTTFYGTAFIASATTMTIQVDTANGTYVQNAAISSTVPMTWATGDSMSLYFAYEVA